MLSCPQSVSYVKSFYFNKINIFVQLFSHRWVMGARLGESGKGSIGRGKYRISESGMGPDNIEVLNMAH